VTYAAADSIIYDISRRMMYSRGKATIDYKELGLKADQVDINCNSAVLNARGSVDSTDTTGSGMKGLPDMIDGNETYHGSEVTYFQNQRRIDSGRRKSNAALLRRGIKKIGNDVPYVEHGRLRPAIWNTRTTTCRPR
jgi:hypothetical protein